MLELKFILLLAFEWSADSAEKDDETWYSLEALWRIRSASASASASALALALALTLAAVSAAGSGDGGEAPARDMSVTRSVCLKPKEQGKDRCRWIMNQVLQ